MGFADTRFGRYMNPPAKKGKSYSPTQHEQIANCFTHALFIIPAMAATSLLLHLSTTSLHTFVAWLYGVGMVSLFAISSLFHAVCLSNRFSNLRWFLHLGDRFIIYAFIAASYMPWLLLQDVGYVGETVTWLLWSAAALGTVYTFLFYEKYKMVETILYLIVGICPSFSLYFARESKGMMELAIGGAILVSGIPLFKSDGRIPFAHAIWHLFVVCGTACQFYAVIIYLYT
ncbi:monocyte to macrophage differentiation factor 2-like [Dendronephthya gigantea]|uniref:monocyte to macrophage differentiation factor 2-like n=1 Tax=Dendronephthya gigantea TaxID=151771 RepID=UPI00106CF94D|nr:monocyte to macrophage differentiation factor 2-like [Dendronephthya gigantea]